MTHPINTAEIRALVRKCQELIEWHETAILCDGAVRDHARSLAEIPQYDRLKVAETEIEMAALKAVPALCDAYEAQAKEIERLKEDLLVQQNENERLKGLLREARVAFTIADPWIGARARMMNDCDHELLRAAESQVNIISAKIAKEFKE